MRGRWDGSLGWLVEILPTWLRHAGVVYLESASYTHMNEELALRAEARRGIRELADSVREVAPSSEQIRPGRQRSA
jgi:hypothetical protein